MTVRIFKIHDGPPPPSVTAVTDGDLYWSRHPGWWPPGDGDEIDAADIPEWYGQPILAGGLVPLRPSDDDVLPDRLQCWNELDSPLVVDATFPPTEDDWRRARGEGPIVPDDARTWDRRGEPGS